MVAFNALFMIGHSPAVLTETLAAVCARDGLNIAEIRVISTRTGASVLRERLFDQNGWESFLDEWPEFSGTRFTDRHIHALACEDIRSESENRLVAEAALSIVRDLTGSGCPPLLASVAGGRKTMSYYMGFAMSLFGRPNDRLTHVLVPSSWETDRSFLVPPRSEAKRIDLVDIPFIRVRDHVNLALTDGNVEALVRSAQASIDMARLEPLELNVRDRALRYLGREVVFSEREFTYLQFFANEKLRNCVEKDRPTCGDCTACFLGFDDIDARKDELLGIRQQYGGIYSANYERFEQAWRPDRSASVNLPEPVSRIAEAVRREFGADPRAERACIRNVGKRGRPRYGLLADKSQIRLIRRSGGE